ncbi:hypothetical protein L5515_006766 [Caenorhabditis briggsae]|uniref:F-box domain-containing protein n=1 Tax=Caenorhabditis briggsae TaxID=6238 RepID=A0AAE9JIJ0_CAEBR|nr:hypothetical protein L5515_006766 [Caenorhabditis briggsae]
MSQQIYKALPIWQEIPEKFKVKIVNLLDFESRFRLRQCSVSDKELVDKCPIIIKSILVVNARDDEISVVIRVKHPRAYYFHALPKTTSMSCVYKFTRIPNVKVLKLGIEYKILPLFLEKLSKDNKTKMNIEMVHFQGGDHAVDRSVVEFLGHLGTNCKKFVFDGICDSEMMEKLGKMAQWKNATGICFPHWNILKLTHFLHCNSLRLAMKEFDPKDAKMLIETFIHKKVFKYDSTFFQIYVETSMNVEEVLMENDDDLKPKLTNAKKGVILILLFN